MELHIFGEPCDKAKRKYMIKPRRLFLTLKIFLQTLTMGLIHQYSLTSNDITFMFLASHELTWGNFH